ncbi:AlpA family transcriptional regulator [Massilia sp. TS11]|uniref:helix-turn-helix transcriptional regulator n=1 Tax=Massilia sp. TS11 TaxID=2908003 RepID=UPI001ED9D3C0|nr:AlpA family transcriptional regulator [Massilia sp. TS11]MCG2586116.1 AlpA family transcriptional regulator [Massilia sp. TS11]
MLPPSDRLLKLREVMHRCALSRSAIYFKIKNGNFPSQVPISSKSVGWLESEINAWLDERRAERDRRSR